LDIKNQEAFYRENVNRGDVLRSITGPYGAARPALKI
jgi:hypothetical protein